MNRDPVVIYKESLIISPSCCSPVVSVTQESGVLWQPLDIPKGGVDIGMTVPKVVLILVWQSQRWCWYWYDSAKSAVDIGMTVPKVVLILVWQSQRWCWYWYDSPKGGVDIGMTVPKVVLILVFHSILSGRLILYLNRRPSPLKRFSYKKKKKKTPGTLHAVSTFIYSSDTRSVLAIKVSLSKAFRKSDSSSLTFFLRREEDLVCVFSGSM